jgi:hypothetical protein
LASASRCLLGFFVIFRAYDLDFLSGKVLQHSSLARLRAFRRNRIRQRTDPLDVDPHDLARSERRIVMSNAQTELERYKTAERIGAEQIAKFDNLDFDVFTNQKWDRLKESHSKVIVVPDGRVTNGMTQHIADMKAMFVYAPDPRIKEHPIKFALGEWTSVIGIMEGTFTKPMPTPDGKSIPPTGKAFKLVMCTVGHWKDPVMDEEYLFWDNLAFMKQIGLAD